MMEKRGVSTIITVVLLILISITAISVVYIVVKGVIINSKENVEQEVTCLTEVDLEIISSCYQVNLANPGSGEILKFTVSNKNNVNYGPDFFLLRVKRTEENFVEIPTSSNSELKAMETNEFFITVDRANKIGEAVFIPKLEENGKECYAQGISFNPTEC